MGLVKVGYKYRHNGRAIQIVCVEGIKVKVTKWYRRCFIASAYSEWESINAPAIRNNMILINSDVDEWVTVNSLNHIPLELPSL